MESDGGRVEMSRYKEPEAERVGGWRAEQKPCVAVSRVGQVERNVGFAQSARSHQSISRGMLVIRFMVIVVAAYRTVLRG